jgi:hypothetical protein
LAAEDSNTDDVADTGGKTDVTAGVGGNGMTEIVLDKSGFSVLNPTHVTVTVGATVSSLENPNFDFRPSGESGKIVVYRKTDAQIQVRPVVHLVSTCARVTTAQNDPDDPTEPTS